MPSDITYNRLKSVQTNETPIATSWLAAEKPATPVAVEAGSTGALDLRCQMDMDPSGSADVITTAKIEIVPVISDASGVGRLVYRVTVTPYDGLGNELTSQAVSYDFTHPVTVDALQTASGNAREA